VKTSKLENLQVLRGAAALMVCVFHSRVFLNGVDVKYGDILFGKGAIGVPLFFIISGFIMVYTTKVSENHFSDFRTFITKRIIRIVPLYYIATLAIIVLFKKYEFFGKSSTKLIQSLLFVTDGWPPLFVGWSLNYEMLFYFIFGIALLFGKYRHILFFSLFLIGMYLIPLLTNGFISFNNRQAYHFKFYYINYLADPILIDFLFGVGLGLILPLIKISKSLIIVTLIVSICGFAFYFFGEFGTTYFDLLFCGLLAVTVLLKDLSNSFAAPNRWLIYLGDISYSVYLVHPIVIGLLPSLMRRFKISQVASQPTLFFVVLGVVLLVSSITHELIEKRLTNFLKRILIQNNAT
jgi:exopolysaccharide production protein ExoZ